MNYILKYDANTYELLGIFKRNSITQMGYIKEEKAMYIPCQDKEDAIKTYKSILREQINYIKDKKRNLNIEKIRLEKILSEVRHK